MGKMLPKLSDLINHGHAGGKWRHPLYQEPAPEAIRGLGVQATQDCVSCTRHMSAYGRASQETYLGVFHEHAQFHRPEIICQHVRRCKYPTCRNDDRLAYNISAAHVWGTVMEVEVCMT